MNTQDLFKQLYNAQTEEEVYNLINENSIIQEHAVWKPLGRNKSNFSIVKNQQSNPIAALIEKLTNSIDALLTKMCLEKGIDPKGSDAPKSMEEAVELFYPSYRDWGQLAKYRKQQAEEIQVIADGPRRKSNVIVYDNGEGQHPQDFEDTFLSLIKGNKNNILFVQGKYNMGGSGGIVFCGKKRYQLIGSKRYDGSGQFGFTLIREHEKLESDNAKETWFEYLTIDGEIPGFNTTELDLGLENRKFKTGTIIKLYNYQFPSGYDAFTGPLTQSINEYLFQPALPILTKDNADRYPNNKVLQNNAFGLSRRLASEEKDYLEDKFSEEFEDPAIGKLKVNCFVFKRRVKDFDAKKTKEVINSRYFKNRMSVMFTMNGQVHGHYTSEFITRSLKMNLLKNYLLVHVDCTNVNYEFRKELFMASRDRLKEGQETQQLRKFLSSQLSKSGSRLKEIEKLRRQAVNIDSSMDTKDLIKNLSKEMPFNSDLMKLLSKSFKLEKFDSTNKKKSQPKSKQKEAKEEIKFKPQRFPSFLKLDKKKENEVPVIQIPKGGEKTIKLNTDVENEYFDRLDEPGVLNVTILGKEDKIEGSSNDRDREKLSSDKNLLRVVKSSPKDGTIRISLGPAEDFKVGEQTEVHVSLSAPGQEFKEIFFVKVSEKSKTKEKPKEEEDPNLLGLPTLILANKEKAETDQVTWEQVGEATGQEMGYEDVLSLQVSGETLEKIFVNMDCTVLLNYRSKHKNPNEEQTMIINKKFYTSVYFHVLFLYTITLNRKYSIHDDNDEEIDIGAYLKDVFSSFYATFILNFGSDVLLESISE